VIGLAASVMGEVLALARFLRKEGTNPFLSQSRIAAGGIELKNEAAARWRSDP